MRERKHLDRMQTIDTAGLTSIKMCPGPLICIWPLSLAVGKGLSSFLDLSQIKLILTSLGGSSKQGLQKLPNIV